MTHLNATWYELEAANLDLERLACLKAGYEQTNLQQLSTVDPTSDSNKPNL